MKRYNYDFSGFDSAMVKLKSDHSKSTTNAIKYELNKFFKDSKCLDVIYTENTDKLFFGMSTYAVMNNIDVRNIISDDKDFRIKSYYIEIDSKLIDLGLTARELTAVLLHEVGHLVNDSSPSLEVRKTLDIYMAETGIQLKDVCDGRYYAINFLKFAFQDSIRRLTSITNRSDQEILADEFVFMCGYGPELQSAFKKIKSNVIYLKSDKSLLGLSWALKVYKDIGIHRLNAIKTLNKLEKLTGSELEKKSYADGEKSLKELREVNLECVSRYDKLVIIENGYVQESDGAGLVDKIRRGGLKGIEEDLYEFNLRIKNVETEEDAMLILRQMNTRMSVLDDYLTYDKDITPKERQRWENVYNKYYDLREDMVRKTLYNKKQYGLWYDYMQLPDSYR